MRGPGRPICSWRSTSRRCSCRTSTCPSISSAILTETGFAPSRLEIEITETALVNDLEAARVALKSLQNLGVRIALDDFGTGYSSLYHLRELQFDKLKIDRSYVASIPLGAERAKLVDAIIALGSSLGLVTTAEGIETASSVDWLAGQGCTYGQGYLFGEPMDKATTDGLLTDWSDDAGRIVIARRLVGGGVPTSPISVNFRASQRRLSPASPRRRRDGAGVALGFSAPGRCRNRRPRAAPASSGSAGNGASASRAMVAVVAGAGDRVLEGTVPPQDGAAPCRGRRRRPRPAPGCASRRRAPPSVPRRTARTIGSVILPSRKSSPTFLPRVSLVPP